MRPSLPESQEEVRPQPDHDRFTFGVRIIEPLPAEFTHQPGVWFWDRSEASFQAHQNIQQFDKQDVGESDSFEDLVQPPKRTLACNERITDCTLVT